MQFAFWELGKLLWMPENLDKLVKIVSDEVIFDRLTDAEKAEIMTILEVSAFDWKTKARWNQLPPPGKWNTWLLLAGRGFGKTRTGAETVRGYINSKKYKRVGLIAPTAADARDVMVEGDSGLLSISPPWENLIYQPTKRRLEWGNGATGSTYSAEEPERLRGPQTDLIWGDEPASWRYAMETFDMMKFGLRLGTDPRAIITGTPKPVELVKMLAKDAVPYHDMREDMTVGVVITKGSTLDNSENLAGVFIEEMKAKYEGTRLGRQELYAEILDDNPGALFFQTNIDDSRLRCVSNEGRIIPKGTNKFSYVMPQGNERPQTFDAEFGEIVVAIDPAMSSSTKSDETGIVVAARDTQKNNHGYLLEDLSGQYTPDEWARVAIHAQRRWRANYIVAETNQGGDLVQHTLRMVDKGVPYRQVKAAQGKTARAEPVGALEEQNRLHHVGEFIQLEDQLTTYMPETKKSPDRLDAYVWAFQQLIVQRAGRSFWIS